MTLSTVDQGSVVEVVDYISTIVPACYCCDNCKKHGVKLWREADTISRPALLCAACTAKQTGRNISGIDASGRYNHYVAVDMPVYTDRIGNFVPAVIIEECEDYWHYSHVPDVGVNWWRSLPTF